MAAPFLLPPCWTQSKGVWHLYYINDLCHRLIDHQPICWRSGLARSRAGPELLAAAGLLDSQQVPSSSSSSHRSYNNQHHCCCHHWQSLGENGKQVASRVGGNRGNSLDLGWSSAESRLFNARNQCCLMLGCLMSAIMINQWQVVSVVLNCWMIFGNCRL